MSWCWWWAGWYVDWCEPEQLEGQAASQCCPETVYNLTTGHIPTFVTIQSPTSHITLIHQVPAHTPPRHFIPQKVFCRLWTNFSTVQSAVWKYQNMLLKLLLILRLHLSFIFLLPTHSPHSEIFLQDLTDWQTDRVTNQWLGQSIQSQGAVTLTTMPAPLDCIFYRFQNLNILSSQLEFWDLLSPSYWRYLDCEQSECSDCWLSD